ncbi:MAG TPA: hypothetical protein DCS87_02360 [Rheinheimera sp.]|nr:hypothetical protein [Rheinheimera sp.]
MNHIISVCFSLLLLCACTTANAQSTTSTKPLIVAMNEEVYPYVYRDSQGFPAGLMVDFWQLMQAQGLNLEVRLIPREKLNDTVLSGEADIFGALGKLPEREKDYLLGEAVVDVYSHVFVHRDLMQTNTLEQLKPIIVGVPAVSSHVSVLKAQAPEVVQREFADIDSMYDAAVAGEIKAFVALDRLNPRYKNFKSLNALYPLYKKILLQKVPMTWAVRKDNQALQQRLLQAFAAIPPEQIEKLQRRWLSGVSDDNTLLLGLSVGNQPFMTMTPSGQPQGLFVDLWQLWSEQTGIPIAFVPDSTPAGLKALQQGRIDVHMGYPVATNPPTDTRMAGRIYQVTSSFYYPKSRHYSNLAEVRLPIGVFVSAAYVEKLRQEYPSVQIKAFEKLDDMVQAVERQQISGFYISDIVMQQRVLQQQKDSYVRLDVPRFQTDLFPLVQQSRSNLAKQVDAGFAALTQDQLEQIEDRWLVDIEMGFFQSFRHRIPLSDQQRDYLSKRQAVRIGVMDNWAPIEFVDEFGQVQGLTRDVVDRISQRLGIQLVLVPYGNFAQMLEDLRSRKIDVVSNMADLPERHEYASYTMNFWPLQWALLGRPAQQVLRMEQIRDSKIAVPADYRIIDTLIKQFGEAQIVKVNNADEALEMVLQGKADYQIDTALLAARLLRRTEAASLRLHLPADLPTVPMLYGVRNDDAMLLDILNLGLKSLTEQDKAEIKNTWSSAEIRPQGTDDRVITIAFQIVGAALISFAVVFFWNLSLRREVSARRDIEHKMRFMATHDDLTKLANRSLLMERLSQAILQHARHQEKLALLFVDLDGFKAVNDQYGHDVGDELLVRIAGILQHCVRKSDTAARFGGDEFVILLTGLMDKDDAAIVAEKVLMHLQEPLQLSVCQAQVGASIGIAIYPDNGADAAAMLKAADGLMYVAKQAGKGRYCFSEQGQ